MHSGKRFWTGKRLAAAALPLLLLFFLVIGIRWALIGPYGVEKSSAILFGCSVGLLFAAYAISRLLFSGRIAAPFYAGIVVVWIGWAWQRFEYVRFIPNHLLQYGYFASPAGKSARFRVLELPFTSILVLLAALFCIHIVVGWRRVRWPSLVLMLWWPVAALVFSLPSLYLELQGDAAIFI